MHVSTEDYHGPSAVTWASDYVMRKVHEKYVGIEMRILESSLAKLLGTPQPLYLPYREYEFWSCRILASGQQVQTLEAGQVSSTGQYEHDHANDIQFVAHDVIPSSDFSKLHVKRGQLLYSQNTKEPLCDAAAIQNEELLLFQMTIGLTHDFVEGKFARYCTVARQHNLERVRFIYVVPFLGKFKVPKKQIDIFKNNTSGINVRLEVAEIRPRRL